jgi:hypothetical protein
MRTQTSEDGDDDESTSDEDEGEGGGEGEAADATNGPRSEGRPSSRTSSSSGSGGSETPSSGSGRRALPTLGVLRLHFAAVHALRARLEPEPLLEAVFHLKEALPLLLLALDDNQMKQVSKNDVREIPAMLQVGQKGGRGREMADGPYHTNRRCHS